MSFSVSIENFGFTVPTPFFFLEKCFFLNCKMSKMHVNHSRVGLDLKKILQCGSAESKTAKLVEDIGSEYCVELKALQKLEYLDIFTSC